MAVNAESLVVELVANVDRAAADIKGYASTVEGSMSRVEKSAAKAERQIVVSAGASAAASRNLGRQISDIGTGLAGGQSPFLILAQQAPQVADALADTGGKAAKVAMFFAGPWGAALLAAGSILGTLAAKAFSATDAKVKLRAATEDLKDAVDRLNSSSALEDHQSRLGIQNDINRARTQRDLALATRQATQAKLDTARADAEQALGRLTSGADPNAAVGNAVLIAQYQRRIAELNVSLNENAVATATAEAAMRNSGVKLGLRDAAAATDAATKANQRYEDSIDVLSRRRASGTISQQAFDREAIRITEERDASLKRIAESEKGAGRAATEARTAARKAAREHVAELKELQSTLEQITDRYDPATANARQYEAALRDIAKLASAGVISDSDALTYQFRAALEYAEKVKDQVADLVQPLEAFGPTGEQQLRKIIDTGDQTAEGEDALKQFDTERQRSDIRSLASFYEDAFKGGASSIGDALKSALVRAVAEALAAKTIGALGTLGSLGGGNPVAGALGAAGSLFHFAQGGSFTVGGKGGTDRNLMSINGSPVAAVSAGERVTVSPAGLRPAPAMAKAAGTSVSTTVNQSFDLRGALVDRDVYADMSRIGAAHAQQAAVAGRVGAGDDVRQAVRKALPRGAG